MIWLRGSYIDAQRDSLRDELWESYRDWLLRSGSLSGPEGQHQGENGALEGEGKLSSIRANRLASGL